MGNYRFSIKIRGFYESCDPGEGGISKNQIEPIFVKTSTTFHYSANPLHDRSTIRLPGIEELQGVVEVIDNLEDDSAHVTLQSVEVNGRDKSEEEVREKMDGLAGKFRTSFSTLQNSFSGG